MLLNSILDGVSVICNTALDMFVDNNKFDYLFEEIGLVNKKNHKPILKDTINGNSYTAYLFSIPVGLSIDDFKKEKSAIAQYLHKSSSDIDIELVNAQVLITVKNEIEVSFNYEDYTFIKNDLRIPIGVNLLTKNIVYYDFTDPSQAHLLIGGSSGGGKSIMLSVIMTHIVRFFDNVELYLQDCKYSDLYPFKDAKQVKYYEDGRTTVEETLSELIDIMAERQVVVRRSNCRDVVSYNKKHKNKQFKYIFMVIEEMGIFDSELKGENSDQSFYKNLNDVLSRGRSAGVYCIMTTQTPYVKHIPGVLKNNINATIGLACNTPQASLSMCGDSEALIKPQALKGKGHGKFFSSDGVQEFQGFNIQEETVEYYMKLNKEGK